MDLTLRPVTLPDIRHPVRGTRWSGLVIALAVLSAGCGLIGGSAIDRAISAGRATSDEGTARIAITTIADAGIGQAKQRTDATGLINFAEGVTELEMRVGAPQLAAADGAAVGGVPLILIGNGDTTLMRSPSWPEDQPWARTPNAAASGAEGFDTTDLGAQLELLSAGVTDVSELGETAVRGVESMQYRMDVDLKKAAEAAPEDQRAPLEQLAEQQGRTVFPLEVWIGDDHVRRLSYVLDIQAAEGQAQASSGATLTTVVEYFDFGVPFDTTIPDNVVDASEIPSDVGAPPAAPEAPATDDASEDSAPAPPDVPSEDG